MSPSRLDLVHGTVDLVILRALAWESMHGYCIAQLVKNQTGGAITLESAALYQALHRLEKRKLVRAWWGVSETKRRAKFYELTSAGRKYLQDESSDLKAYVGALFRLLDAK